MNLDDYYGVIMAGGGGTRLWPLSRRGRPKQTLTLFGQRSLFQIAVERVKPLIPADRLRIVTVADQLDLLRQQVPELPASSFVLEPAPRGTAAVVGLAAITLQEQDPDAVMCVLTADHYIEDEQLFRELLRAAYRAAKEGHLVTLGVRPVVPSTGYGYLQQGERVQEVEGRAVYRVVAFREKPDAEQAVEYLESGRYLWNSGMFIWRVDRILTEFERHMPELAAGLRRIQSSLGGGSEREQLEAIWQGLQPETIDYGVMEKAEDVVLIPAEGLGWWDVGSWDRLFDVLEPSAEENLILAPSVVSLDTEESLILQDEGQTGDRLIATLGVRGLVIVDTGEALLVTTRERAQDVRSIVDALKREGNEQYL